jgi:hypothetical protein
VGDRVTLSLFDFPAGAPVDEILIAGLNVTPANISRNVPPSGQTSFGFDIPGIAPLCIPTGTGTPATVAPCLNVGDDNPDAGLRVPTGTQRIDVNTGTATGATTDDGGQDTNIVIGGARLTLSHQEVIANQDLTISGSGFSEGSNVCVEEGSITLANISLKIDDDDVNTTNCTRGVLLSSGGTFTATVRVHDVTPTNDIINVALLTEGNQELKVIDSLGSEGTVQLTIPGREITVVPLAARPRDLVTIIGTNFVADNPDGLSTSVDVEYQCSGDSRSTTADPDASGNFRETLRIPSNCSIPSTNTITATIRAEGDTGIVETVTHEIPDALVRVEPVRGVAGGTVTVTGEGFRTFETVEKIEFGGRGTLGGRTITTDGNGNFSVDDIVVPGIDPGVRAVIVEVGTDNRRTTSSTSFEIVRSEDVGSGTTPIEDALAPLFEGDTLDRVFFFNNTTKEWAFYINDPAFEDANDLDDIASGLPLWIKVTGDTTVELNNVEFDLTCLNPGTDEEDCWNQIVFP